MAFWQEHKADNAIELLKEKLAPNALVVATTLGLFGVVSSFGIFNIGEEILHLSREALKSNSHHLL